MSQPKTILFGPLPPPYGGVAVVMSTLREPAIASGSVVWSYAGDDGDERVVKLNHRILGHIRRLLTTPTVSRVVDSTHFHLEYPHWLLLPAWLLARRIKGFRWIKTCHDGSLPFRYSSMSSGARRRFRRALDSIDEMVVSSHELAEFFRDKFTGPIRYISPLMPLPASWDPPTLTAERAAKVVTSIGAFIPSYGFQHVADAVESLRDRGRDLELVLLDGAFARDEAYRASVLKNRRWIRVHEGVRHSEVSTYLRESDVFVRAFAHESYGLSRVEAILSSVPVIATNIGETRGMLTYEFGDAGRLVEHLESILDRGSEQDLARWQEVYRAEALENLQQYSNLITGESNA